MREEPRPHRRYLEQHKEGSSEARKTLAIVEALDALAERLAAAIEAAPDPAPPNLSAFFGTLAAEPNRDFVGGEEAEATWTAPAPAEANDPGAPGGGA